MPTPRPHLLFSLAILLVGYPHIRAEVKTGIAGVASQTAVVDVSHLPFLSDEPAPGQVVHAPGIPSGELSGEKNLLDRQAKTEEPVVQAASLIQPLSPAATTNFFGAGDNGWIPPDTMGAVGPNHLVVAVNGTFQVQDRAGRVLQRSSLDQFWFPVGPFGGFTFDPKVFYDAAADRFIIVSCADVLAGSSSVLLGASQTGDPTRAWNLYRIDADPQDQLWADYPSLGFNGKWIAVSMNMFPITGNNFQVNIWAFDKDDIYRGGAGRFTLLTDNSGFTMCPAVTLDNEPILYIVESYGDRRLRISNITGNIGQERLNVGAAFVLSPQPWSFFGGNIAPQKDLIALINNGDHRIQNVVFRNGFLWAAHTIFLPAGGTPNRSAVQWWQINPNGTILQRGRIEDPDIFFAYPSIAVNQNSDVMVGYSTFGRDQYASAGYSFRFAADPSDTLQAPFVFKAGDASYIKLDGSGRNRWGDYSATMVDPVNDINFWTLQEYAAPRVGGQSQWGTWWAFLDISEPPDGLLEVFVTPPDQSSLIAGNATNILVRVFDVSPVTNATVEANITGLGRIDFVNTGTGPDPRANDNEYGGTLLVPSTAREIIMNVVVRAPGKQTFSTNITYQVFPLPPNDLFANAIKIPSGGAFGENLIRTANSFATVEPGEPNHGGSTNRVASLWWNWSAPASTRVLVDTSGSGIDTVIGVYTGDKVDALTQVASVNDVGSRPDGYLFFTAVPGITYRIAIAGATTNALGPIRLRVEPNGQPDVTPPRITITSPPSGITTNVDFVQIVGTAFDPQPNASGLQLVRLIQETAATRPSDLREATDWVFTVKLDSLTNRFSIFAVDFANNTSPKLELVIYRRDFPLPNDLIAKAVLLDETNVVAQVATNSLAGKEVGEPSHAGNIGGRSIWWRFRPTTDGILLLTTQGSTNLTGGALDTLLAVYSLAQRQVSVTNLTQVASNDDAPDGQGYSELTMPVRADTDYFIAVDTYSREEGVVQLAYNFSRTPLFSVVSCVNNPAQGMVRPGPTSGDACATNYFPSNAAVAFEAVPANGFVFDYFVVNGDTNAVKRSNPLSVAISENLSVEAFFRPRTFTETFGGLNNFQMTVGWEASTIIRTNEVGELIPATVARTTIHGPGQIARLVLVTNLLPGLGSFELRVNTETNYDRLEFSINGDPQESWSGQVDWQLFSFEITPGVAQAGPVTLEWRYVKDNALNDPIDTAFLDNLDLPIGTLAGSRPRLSIAADGLIQVTGALPNRIYLVQGTSDLSVDWTTLSSVQADSQGRFSFREPGAPGGGVRFYRVVQQ